MRILYIDIDTLRPDHLGCYGYHRDTSPNIDAIAADGIRFNQCFASDVPENNPYPRQPAEIRNMAAARLMFDSYDVGIRYADHYIGKVIKRLKDQGIYDDTIIIVTSDHGETLGELNCYGDHQYADYITCRIPMIVKLPQQAQAGREDQGLCYHMDIAAIPEEFYDFEQDPDALNNLIDNPAYAPHIQALRDELERWMEQTDDPALTALRHRHSQAALDRFMADTACDLGGE